MKYDAASEGHYAAIDAYDYTNGFIYRLQIEYNSSVPGYVCVYKINMTTGVIMQQRVAYAPTWTV